MSAIENSPLALLTLCFIFNFSTVDDVNPEITCPTSFSVTTSFGTNGRAVTWNQATATDNSNIVTVTNTNPNLNSGAFLPLGATTITYIATDGAGNTATCSFTITVIEGNPEKLDELICVFLKLC